MAETRTYAMTGEMTLSELGNALEKYLGQEKKLRTGSSFAAFVLRRLNRVFV